MFRMKKSSPLIAITCGTDSELPRRRELYMMAVKRGGGEPFFVHPQNDLNDLVMRFDGLIIPGGRDLDPSLYGESPRCRIEAEGQERTDFEFSILREIMERKKPVFGICYGIQFINIFLQGSLYQDILLQVPGSLEHTRGEHGVTIEDNQFMEAGESVVNSSHHQAIKRVGKGLKPFAWSHDGIIEAFYGEGFRFLVGVQWHPERMQSSLSARLFEKFVGACRV